MSARRRRGATLLEILITMAVVVLGMVVLFRVLTASTRGSVRAQQLSQALARSRTVMENIRRMPVAVLTCLSRQPANNWATCEATCIQTLGALATPGACVFVTLASIQQEMDRSQQQYQIVDDASDPARSSWVTVQGTSGHLFDVQVTVGWNDDGSAAPATHRVTLHSATFQ